MLPQPTFVSREIDSPFIYRAWEAALLLMANSMLQRMAPGILFLAGCTIELAKDIVSFFTSLRA